MVKLFLTSALRLFNGERPVFSTNTVVKIGYSHTQKLKLEFHLTPCTKLKLTMDGRPECKS